MQKVLHISVPIKTEIGEGLYIGHTGRVVISSLAVIGKNFNIAAGGTIGKENRGSREGAPIIGDNVWVGTNAYYRFSIEYINTDTQTAIDEMDKLLREAVRRCFQKDLEY